MKRIFLFLTIIIAYNANYAQVSDAYYELNISGYVGDGGKNCGTQRGLQFIELFFQNGKNDVYFDPSIYENRNLVTPAYQFKESNKITQIHFHTARRYNIGCRTNRYNGYVNINTYCYYRNYDFSEFGSRVSGNAVIKIRPHVNIAQPLNTIFSDEEPLIIDAITGIHESFFNWEYSVDSYNWSPLPAQFQGKNSLKIKGKEFPGELIFGSKVYIRVNMGNCGGNIATSNSNIFFTYLKSAPHIIGQVESPVKCHDSQDGSITLHFDRTLLEGEVLKYSLLNTITGAAHSNGELTNLLQNSTSLKIENLGPGNYKLDLLGTYKNSATYTDGDRHSTRFEIKRPSAVEFSLVSKTNVFCHQGEDGIINIYATGGQNHFQYSITGDNGIDRTWTDFNNGNNTSITNLPAGNYQIRVQDSNLCIAKENGNTKVITVNITEPSVPVQLSEIEIKEPTGYGLSNGYISVRVTGGTPNNDNSYNFEWRKDSPTGTIISTDITTDGVNNPFTIKLGNIPKGKYYLTVKDKNYAGASSNLNTCSIISEEYEVNQPDSLIATIEVKKIISCHINNDYQYKLDLDGNGVPDEAETGELRAIVTGGVGNYTYQWQILSESSFQNIPGATSNILTKLKEGTYKILVKDVNDNKADKEKVFSYPEILKIDISANTILCNSQNEGIVSVAVTGGTAPYSYYWNTTDTVATVKGLSAGNYFVVVQDANKCTVSGNIRIGQPEHLEIEDILVQNPICNGASNGIIQIKASGGKSPYSVVWSNGKTGEYLSGLKAGVYTVTFTDANGCATSKYYTLSDPEPFTIDLGKDITLCQGDSHIYDIKIDDSQATYQWIDAQGNIIGTDSSIELSEAGIYTATVIDSKGCIATDQVEIRNSMEILSPEFMIASHAFVDKTVELINTSSIQPEKVEWILPESDYITVISESEEHIELRFSQIGSYQIGLKGIQGLCEKTIYKDILIEENIYGVEEPATTSSNIEDFIILPNPNDGNYKVIVKLYKEAAIKLRIINMSGKEPLRNTTYAKSSEFEIPFSHSLATGVYLVVLETGSEVQVKRMIVNH